jgi:hypothetical protein
MTEVVSVRFQRKTRLVLLRRAEISGGLDQMATRYRCVFRVPGCSAPTSLPPFAPRPLRRFNAPMEALTPVRCHDSERLAKWTFLPNPSHRPPCFTHSTVLTIPSPTTLCSPVAAFSPATLFVSATGLRSLYRILAIHSSQAPGDRSRLRRRIAGSPKTPGRSGFVILRTGRSPPVALHPASWRRSYSRLSRVDRGIA